MFATFVDNPNNPVLKASHIMNTISETVPLSTTMKEQIVALRGWAITRAKNASCEPNMEENKDYQIKRIEDNSTPEASSLKNEENNTNVEVNKIEEEKKLSTSRLFILFVILDCILGLFLVAELVWLFVDFFSKAS